MEARLPQFNIVPEAIVTKDSFVATAYKKKFMQLSPIHSGINSGSATPKLPAILKSPGVNFWEALTAGKIVGKTPKNDKPSVNWKESQSLRSGSMPPSVTTNKRKLERMNSIVSGR